MSRTEAFLDWVEEHPGEYLEAIQDKTDALVKQLEERERAAHRTAKRPTRYVQISEYGSDVPF